MRRMYSENQLNEMKKDITSLVDKDGHDRFISGNVDLDYELEGLTKTYGKWSLSGNHLMIVLCLQVANGTTIPNDITLVDITNMPQWLYDKIYGFIGNFVDYKSVPWWSSGLGAQSSNILLQKPNTNTLRIKYFTSFTASADRGCRIAFDLIIE